MSFLHGFLFSDAPYGICGVTIVIRSVDKRGYGTRREKNRGAGNIAISTSPRSPVHIVGRIGIKSSELSVIHKACFNESPSSRDIRGAITVVMNRYIIGRRLTYPLDSDKIFRAGNFPTNGARIIDRFVAYLADIAVACRDVPPKIRMMIIKPIGY